jgi:hydrogenase maturation protease
VTDGPATGVLVVGYGNPLRSDDGVGPAVAVRLAADPRLRGADVRAEHQLTPELALDASGASLLVLIDAAEDLAAGEIAVRRAGPQRVAGGGPVEEAGPPLTHHLDPGDLLGLARQLFGAEPDEVVIIGIGPASLEVGETLSTEVEAAATRAVELVAELVAERVPERVAIGRGEP